IARGAYFEEDLVVADLDVEAVFRTRLHDPLRRKDRAAAQVAGAVKFYTVSTEPAAVTKAPLTASPQASPPGPEEEVYRALVLGLGDYVRKSGFKKVLLGLSGGIDSSLTATIAVDALGKENVLGVAMPSRYSSEGSLV